MAEIKKITLRFNLGNEQDKRIWDEIQEHNKKTEYIKHLVQADMEHQEQQSVLKEIREIKGIIEQLSTIDKKSSHLAPQTPQKVQEPVLDIGSDVKTTEIEESSVIDEDVMNFLDNL